MAIAIAMYLGVRMKAKPHIVFLDAKTIMSGEYLDSRYNIMILIQLRVRVNTVLFAV